MLGGIGVQEILVILIVGLLVFGATRLPKIARSLGLGIKEFKKTIKSVEDDDEEEEKGQIRYVQNQPPAYQQYPPSYTSGPGMQQPGQGPYYGQNPQYQPPQGGGYGQPGPQPGGQQYTQQQPPQQPQQQPPQQPQQDQPKPDEEKQG